jgi:alkylation response protein AidB-like acyl-CoA dehydrogenase
MVQTSGSEIVTLVDLAEAMRPVIEAGRDEAERLRRMPAPLADELRRAGAFRLTTPIELGGHECRLSEQLAVLESLARVDGPVAWNVWNGNLGFVAAMLGADAAATIWDGGRDPIIANAAQPTGTATGDGGALVLSGRWKMLSAVDNADWVALFAFVMDGPAPAMTAHGPDLRVFLLPASDVQILDTWHTSGMRATGSNTVVVDRAPVPATLTVSPFAPFRIDRPAYRVPAFTQASIGAAPIVLGMAQSLIDAVVSAAATKLTDNGETLAARSSTHAQLGEAQTALDAARALLIAVSAQIDAMADDRMEIDVAVRARLRAAMSHAAAVCRDVVATCRRLAGTAAVYAGEPVERICRDSDVALQHYLLSPTHLDPRGRLLLGLDPGTAIL